MGRAKSRSVVISHRGSGSAKNEFWCILSLTNASSCRNYFRPFREIFLTELLFIYGKFPLNNFPSIYGTFLNGAFVYLRKVFFYIRKVSVKFP